MQRAFEIAASGEIGEVKWVGADLGFPAPYSPSSRLWAPKDGGGALLDLTVYPLLWALGTLGFPQTVSATGWVNDDGVDAQNALTLGYHHGAQAQLISSLLAHGPRTATVAGSQGFLQTTGSINNPKELQLRIGFDEPRTEHFTVVGPRLQLRAPRGDTLHPAGAHREPGHAAGGLPEHHAAVRRRPRATGRQLPERRPLTPESGGLGYANFAVRSGLAPAPRTYPEGNRRDFGERGCARGPSSSSVARPPHRPPGPPCRPRRNGMAGALRDSRQRRRCPTPSRA